MQHAASGGIGSEPILAWMAHEAPELLLCSIVTATAALWWPDDSVGNAAKFCRSVCLPSHNLCILISGNQSLSMSCLPHMIHVLSSAHEHHWKATCGFCYLKRRLRPICDQLLLTQAQPELCMKLIQLCAVTMRTVLAGPVELFSSAPRLGQRASS